MRVGYRTTGWDDMQDLTAEFDKLGGCFSSASLQIPDRMLASAWKGHAPFAFWLIETHRPQVLVELGTHNGFSYFSFCQQIRRTGLAARATAIDTWRGDEQAGFYDESVFQNFRRYHDLTYGDFSRFIRSTFDEALGQFTDGSIDLLHIDGRHRYEGVRHDYETWKPKLSSRAIVLFHDTQVRSNNFGVFKFWQEISELLPHFEFEHAHGLGVLGVGEAQRLADFPLFAKDLTDEKVRAIRTNYARLGSLFDGSRLMRRNDPCPCESGKRYKHCHGKPDAMMFKLISAPPLKAVH
jgi:methyltransferase family protein/SEC-C motif-containing protein